MLFLCHSMSIQHIWHLNVDQKTVNFAMSALILRLTGCHGLPVASAGQGGHEKLAPALEQFSAMVPLTKLAN